MCVKLERGEEKWQINIKFVLAPTMGLFMLSAATKHTQKIVRNYIRKPSIGWAEEEIILQKSSHIFSPLSPTL